MRVTRHIAETRAALAQSPHPLALVPTMGALHEGHLSLLRAARAWAGAAGTVVMSLFVNPAQFGPDEDYDRYPRHEASDLGLAERAGVDLVFAPPVDEMYPAGFATSVHVAGPLSEAYEGASRPGHFDGVATVVAKLLAIVRPDAAFFGRKDAQQLALVRRLTADLNLGCQIIAGETVREPSGLAMSSRNRYLNDDERAAAARLYQALQAGRAAAARSHATPATVVAAAQETLAPAGLTSAVTDQTSGEQRTGEILLDYLAVVDPDTFVAETALKPTSLLIAAVRIGQVRLIDNVTLAASTTNEPINKQRNDVLAEAVHNAQSPPVGEATT